MTSSIATFPQPIHGTATKDSLPRIAIAMEANGDDTYLWVINVDGNIESLLINEYQPLFNVGLRYDPRSETWQDTAASMEEEE